MLLRRISLEWRRRASNFRYGAITRGCSSSTSHSGCLSAQARPRSSFSCAGAQHHQPTGHRTSYPLLDGRLSPLSLCSWRETPLRRLHSSSSSSSSSSTRRRHHEFTVITQGCENFSSRRSYSSSSSSSIDMATTKHLVTDIRLTSDLESDEFDGIVAVAPSIDDLPHEDLRKDLRPMLEIDAKAEKGVFLLPLPSLPKAKRCVFSGTGQMDKDYDDARNFSDAAEKGFARAVKAGFKKPLFVFGVGKDSVKERFPHSASAALLGALKATYVTLEMREAKPEKKSKVDKVGVFSASFNQADIDLVKALEAGRAVCRDIGGSDPERMAAPRVEEYVRELFADCNNVSIEVVKGHDVFEKEYPCFAAVDRAASVIPRHQGRVIWLTYEPDGPAEKTLMLVGKGVTYDTGGADIKAGGIMAGMSRDKCGAASVAGIMRAISMLKPAKVKVVAALCMVRNSVGENCYVSDEIVTSRAGVRLRVGNTDAEGRMAMCDVLCHAKEKALNLPDPHLLTIATLTGHAARTYGGYSAIMDNGPAAKVKFAHSVQRVGESFGDAFEISTMRKEDFEVNRDPCGDFVEVLQLPAAKDSGTRGHQYAGAFLQLASGLDKHMMSSEKPLKYSHLDIAGSAGRLPEITTASSVVGLVLNAVGGY